MKLVYQWKILEDEINPDFMKLLRVALQEGWLSVEEKNEKQSYILG